MSVFYVYNRFIGRWKIASFSRKIPYEYKSADIDLNMGKQNNTFEWVLLIKLVGICKAGICILPNIPLSGNNPKMLLELFAAVCEDNQLELDFCNHLG